MYFIFGNLKGIFFFFIKRNILFKELFGIGNVNKSWVNGEEIINMYM